MNITFWETLGLIVLVSCTVLMIDDIYFDLQTEQNTFRVLDGCEEFRASCNNVTNTLIDEIHSLDEELRLKDEELKAEKQKPESKEENTMSHIFMLIVAIFFCSYLLLDRYLIFKREENRKDRDEKEKDKDEDTVK